MQRSAFIVGAASGMGRATALRLAEAGYSIGLADLDIDRLQDVAAELEARNVEHAVTEVDLADAETIERRLQLLSNQLGPPWLVGVSAGILEKGWAVDVSLEHYRRVVDINLIGAIAANIWAARTMILQRSGGRIINWSSNNSIGGTAGASAYAASKAGLNAFTQSLAVELGPYEITVNALVPGSVNTPMLADVGKRDREVESSRIPIGRWGEPEDVAPLVTFLASDEAAWITGACIPVDGGTLANQGRRSLSEAVRRSRLPLTTDAASRC